MADQMDPFDAALADFQRFVAVDIDGDGKPDVMMPSDAMAGYAASAANPGLTEPSWPPGYGNRSLQELPGPASMNRDFERDAQWAGTSQGTTTENIGSYVRPAFNALGRVMNESGVGLAAELMAPGSMRVPSVRAGGPAAAPIPANVLAYNRDIMRYNNVADLAGRTGTPMPRGMRAPTPLRDAPANALSPMQPRPAPPMQLESPAARAARGGVDTIGQMPPGLGRYDVVGHYPFSMKESYKYNRFFDKPPPPEAIENRMLWSADQARTIGPYNIQKLNRDRQRPYLKNLPEKVQTVVESQRIDADIRRSMDDAVKGGANANLSPDSWIGTDLPIHGGQQGAPTVNAIQEIAQRHGIPASEVIDRLRGMGYTFGERRQVYTGPRVNGRYGPALDKQIVDELVRPQSADSPF